MPSSKQIAQCCCRFPLPESLFCYTFGMRGVRRKLLRCLVAAYQLPSGRRFTTRGRLLIMNRLVGFSQTASLNGDGEVAADRQRLVPLALKPFLDVVGEALQPVIPRHCSCRRGALKHSTTVYRAALCRSSGSPVRITELDAPR